MSPEKPVEHIEKVSVPDDAVQDWIKTLHEGGFTSEEIDTMMTHLNETYLTKRFSDFIERELQDTIADLERKSGKVLIGERREWLRGKLVDHMQSMNYSDLLKWEKEHKEKSG